LQRRPNALDVANWSKAALTAPKSHFRFAPESGLKSDIAPCPKSAMNRLMRRSNSKCYSTISSAQIEQRRRHGEIERLWPTVSSCEAVVSSLKQALHPRLAAPPRACILLFVVTRGSVIALRGINPPAAGLATARGTARIPA